MVIIMNYPNGAIKCDKEMSYPDLPATVAKTTHTTPTSSKTTTKNITNYFLNLIFLFQLSLYY